MGGFEDFGGETWPRLAATLGFFCHDAGVGQELAQETLARVWARWDHVGELTSPEAWAYRVGLNLARSRFRRTRAEHRALRRLNRSEATAADPADALAVRAAVGDLQERSQPHLW